MSLERYRQKRRLDRTPEPGPKARRGKRNREPIFVVQLHHARNRHYDFRLEIDGALKSWAVPKGPSLRPGEKRLAVEVEDHPLAYADFAGDIPKGHYGAGHVDIFDRGTWTAKEDASAGLAAGKLEFELHGERLRGGWKLVRTQLRGKQPQWLLFKRDDDAAADAEADDLIDRKSGTGKTPKRGKVSATGSNTTGKATTKNVSASKRVSGQLVDWKARALVLAGARKRALPEFIAPQLTQAVTHPPAGADWLHEVKWDGYRLLAAIEADNVMLWSRNQIDWSQRLPELSIALQAAPPGTRLDGELIALDRKGRSDFAALQRALKAKRTAGLRYALFDLPALAGVDLRRAPLQARKALLEDWLASLADPRLVYSSHSIGNGADALEASAEHGLEGIISKRIDAPYHSGRGDDWRKLRHVQSDEFLVVGYTDPQGARSGFGSLLLASVERGVLRYMGRVGSGFNASSLTALTRQLRALARTEPVVALPDHVPFNPRNVHWVQPQLVAEVRYRGLGKEGLLRQASFKALRDDKHAAELGVQGDKTMNAATKARKPTSKPVTTGDAVRKPARRASGKTVARQTNDATTHLSSPDRIVYRGLGITKADVADYYRRVSRWLLPAVAGRPLSLLRCPDGVGGECFFQKNHEPSLGAHVRALPLKMKDGSRAQYVAIDDVAGLLELVQMNTLELHPWGATGQDPEHPDVLVFDLDPGPKVAWSAVVGAARELRARLLDVDLHSWPRLSGGKGIHVVLPIAPVHDWDTAKTFCESFARTLAKIAPAQYVATASKALRERRIFIDWLRNGRGATSVASWSLRARAGAPVAMPLRWDELGRAKSGSDYDLAKALRRAATLRRDPWHDWLQHRSQRLPE